MSLRWRDGDTSVIAWYHANDRIRTGRLDQLPNLMFAEWKMVEADGLIGQMMAPTNQQVTELNARALADRRTAEHTAAQHGEASDGGVSGAVAGDVPRTQRERLRRLFTVRNRNGATSTAPPLPPREITLRDGLTVREGDRIATRKNRYDLRLTGSRGPVRNGHLYQLARIHADGSATVIRLDRKTRQAHTTQEKTTLPADYLTTFCEVGYAATNNAEQGDTVDVALGLYTPAMTRQNSYVPVTRGRESNLLFVPDDILPDPTNEHHQPGADPADAILKDILNRDSAPLSAHEQADREKVKIRALDTTIPAYQYVADQLDRQAMHATITHALDGTTDDPKGAAWELMDEPAWSSLQPKLDRAQNMAGGDPVARHQLITRLITEAPDTTPQQQAADAHTVAFLLRTINHGASPAATTQATAPASDTPAGQSTDRTSADTAHILAVYKAISDHAVPNARDSFAGAESPAKVLHHRLTLIDAAERKKAAAWLRANHEYLTEQLPELAYTASQAASVLRSGKTDLAAHQQDAIDTITVLARQPIPGVAVAQLAAHTAPPEPIIERPELDARDPQGDPELDLELPPHAEPAEAAVTDDGALPPAPYTADADYLAVACDDAQRRHTAADRTRDPMLPTWVSTPAAAHWDGGDTELITWQQHQHDKIIARTRELAGQIADLPPEWAKPYGPAPEPGTTDRRTWDRTIGHIAAWREQHRITHPRDALGAQPRSGDQRGHWQTLHDQAHRLEQQATERAQPTPNADSRPQTTDTRTRTRAELQQEQQRLQPPPAAPSGPRIST